MLYSIYIMEIVENSLACMMDYRIHCYFPLFQIRESKSEFYQKRSEMFESLVYLEEVADVLCIAQAELPSLLPITEVAETLLHVPNGGWMLCRLVANSPDCYKEGIIYAHYFINRYLYKKGTFGCLQSKFIIQVYNHFHQKKPFHLNLIM